MSGSWSSQSSNCIWLVQCKCKYLLKLLQKVLPKGNCMPKSRNEAKKTLATLGLDYEGLHACSNDQVLFRKELENEVQCTHCGVSHN